MSDPASDVNEVVCWQCGAPADPVFAFIKVLNASAKQHKDGQGYPVDRGKWLDTVRVPIPCCKTCRNRYRSSRFLVFPLGAVLWGVGLRSGVAFLFGGLGTTYALHLAILHFERRSGRRSIDDYPPLQRLRQDGWFVVNWADEGRAA
jgi:hypothetical protein